MAGILLWRYVVFQSLNLVRLFLYLVFGQRRYSLLLYDQQGLLFPLMLCCKLGIFSELSDINNASMNLGFLKHVI